MANYFVVVINIGQSSADAVTYEGTYNVGPGQIIQFNVVAMRVVLLVIEQVFQHLLRAWRHNRSHHDFGVSPYWTNDGRYAQRLEAWPIIVTDNLDGYTTAEIGFRQPVGNIKRQAV